MRQIMTWFLFQQKSFPSDYIKMIWVLNLIRGPKVDSWVNSLDLALKTNNTTHPDYCQTWSKFYDLLKYKFEDKNIKANAQIKIQTINQGGSTVDEYISDFQILARESHFNDEALLLQFLRGLKDSIFRRSSQYAPVHTYTEWLALARRIEQDMYIHTQLTAAAGGNQPVQKPITIPAPHPRQQQQPPRNQFGQYQQCPPQHFQQQPNNRFQQQRPVQQFQHPPPPARPIAPLAPQNPPGTHPTFAPMDLSRVRNKDERTCFRCRQKGHFIKDCPVKAVNELNQESINEILTAHLSAEGPPEPSTSSPSRPPVMYEEVPDENTPGYYYEVQQEQEQEPTLYFEEDQGQDYVDNQYFY